MKATQSTKYAGMLTAIALVTCMATFSAPASALANGGLKLGLHQSNVISQAHLLGTPTIVHRVISAKLSKAHLPSSPSHYRISASLLKALDTTPSTESSTPPTQRESTPTIMVPSHPTTEPPVFVRTPNPPHRHRLPFTGGDYTSYLLVGLGVITLGIAFLGFGSRTKADQIRSDR
jgi:uncharacterized surface anchored protein